MACSPTSDNPGNYAAHLHWMGSTGVRFDTFVFDHDNPLRDGVPALASELQKRLSHKYKFLEKTVVRFEMYMGISVVRHCEGVGSAETHDSAQSERVATLAIAREPANMLAVKRHDRAEDNRLKSNAIGSAQPADKYSRLDRVSPLVYLSVAPAEHRWPVEFAIEAGVSPINNSVGYVALRTVPGTIPMPNENADSVGVMLPTFVETIMHPSELAA